MLREEVNQGLLDLFKDPAYLEIGVAQGTTFHAVRAAQKVAVDPWFQFDVSAMKADPGNAGAEYHEVLSDVYFSDIKEPDQKFDIIFIDGLHTFDQTLKDLLNSICSLKEGGILVVDDVWPSSYAASIPDVKRFENFQKAVGNPDGSWMGDVYRLVFFIQQYLPLFNYATVLENHGQTVMWRGRRPSTGEYVTKVEKIARLEYEDTVMRREVFNFKKFSDIVYEIKHGVD